MLTTLKVLNNFAETPLPAKGPVTTPILGGVPSLTVLTDASGNGILLGFADPAQNTNTLDAMSTAVALLYMRIAGPTASSDFKLQILAAIKADPATATVAAVIAARVAANPTAIADGDTQIANALQTAYLAIGGGSGPSGAPMGLPASNLPDMLVQPSGPQSGFEIVQDDSSVSVRGVNNYRRRCQLNLYRVSETAADGTLNKYTQGVPVGGPISVDGTTRLGLFSTIENLLTGHTAFTPVETSQIFVALQPQSIRTDFEIVVLGASGAVSEPPIFSDAPVFVRRRHLAFHSQEA